MCVIVLTGNLLYAFLLEGLENTENGLIRIDVELITMLFHSRCVMFSTLSVDHASREVVKLWFSNLLCLLICFVCELIN